MIETFLLKYGWKLILGAVMVFAVWWYVIYTPAQLKAVKRDLEIRTQELSQAREALVLLDNIQKGKGKIDVQVQRQISSARATVLKPGAVLISGGMPKAMSGGDTPAR